MTIRLVPSSSSSSPSLNMRFIGVHQSLALALMKGLYAKMYFYRKPLVQETTRDLAVKLNCQPTLSPSLNFQTAAKHAAARFSKNGIVSIGTSAGEQLALLSRCTIIDFIDKPEQLQMLREVEGQTLRSATTCSAVMQSAVHAHMSMRSVNLIGVIQKLLMEDKAMKSVSLAEKVYA